MSELPGANYRAVREKLDLTTWSHTHDEPMPRDPTNAEILLLLDALHADQMGEEGPELARIREERWWNS